MVMGIGTVPDQRGGGIRSGSLAIWNPARLVASQAVGRHAPAGLVLKIGHTQAPARSCLQTLFRYDAGETATTPNVTPPFQGLSTPVTSAVTNCMLSCNSQSANCQTTCVLPTPRQVPANSTYVAPQLNATASGACLAGCTSTQLACQTSCARLSSIVGQ